MYQYPNILAETDKKSQEHDLQESPPSDGSNTTVRRSSRGLQSGSSTESTGSKGKKKASQMARSGTNDKRFPSTLLIICSLFNIK